jgi:hypothetical protein
VELEDNAVANGDAMPLLTPRTDLLDNARNLMTENRRVRYIELAAIQTYVGSANPATLYSDQQIVSDHLRPVNFLHCNVRGRLQNHGADRGRHISPRRQDVAEIVTG